MLQPKIEVKNLRNGVGSVFMEKQDVLPAHCKMYSRITINPGSSIGPHTHMEDEEIIYVLKGNGQVMIDGIMHPFSEGTVHITKKGENHSVINNSIEPLVILAVINE